MPFFSCYTSSDILLLGTQKCCWKIYQWKSSFWEVEAAVCRCAVTVYNWMMSHARSAVKTSPKFCQNFPGLYLALKFDRITWRSAVDCLYLWRVCSEEIQKSSEEFSSDLQLKYSSFGICGAMCFMLILDDFHSVIHFLTVCFSEMHLSFDQRAIKTLTGWKREIIAAGLHFFFFFFFPRQNVLFSFLYKNSYLTLVQKKKKKKKLWETRV